MLSILPSKLRLAAEALISTCGWQEAMTLGWMSESHKVGTFQKVDVVVQLSIPIVHKHSTQGARGRSDWIHGLEDVPGRMGRFDPTFCKVMLVELLFGRVSAYVLWTTVLLCVPWPTDRGSQEDRGRSDHPQHPTGCAGLLVHRWRRRETMDRSVETSPVTKAFESCILAGMDLGPLREADVFGEQRKAAKTRLTNKEAELHMIRSKVSKVVVSTEFVKPAELNLREDMDVR